MDLENSANGNPIMVKNFLVRVYLWMCLGLLATFLVSVTVVSIIGNSPVLFLPIGILLPFALIAELIIVVVLSFLYNRLSPVVAGSLFVVYSVLNGISFGLLLMEFELTSVLAAFIATSLTFLAVALFGYFTKHDLRGIGNLAIFGLFALVIGTVVNIIVYLINPALADGISWFLTYFGLAVFVVLIAVDNQKLKIMAQSGVASQAAIRGALMLYLDFINLFLRILFIIGRKK